MEQQPEDRQLRSTGLQTGNIGRHLDLAAAVHIEREAEKVSNGIEPFAVQRGQQQVQHAHDGTHNRVRHAVVAQNMQKLRHRV